MRRKVKIEPPYHTPYVEPWLLKLRAWVTNILAFVVVCVLLYFAYLAFQTNAAPL